MTSYNLSVPWDSPSVQFRIGNKICLLTKRRKKATILKWWNIILIRLDTWSAYLKQWLVSVPPVESARCVSVTNILSTININNLLSYPRYSLHTCEWQGLNNETADRAAPSNLRISICVGRSLVNRNKPIIRPRSDGWPDWSCCSLTELPAETRSPATPNIAQYLEYRCQKILYYQVCQMKHEPDLRGDCCGSFSHQTNTIKPAGPETDTILGFNSPIMD